MTKVRISPSKKKFLEPTKSLRYMAIGREGAAGIWEWLERFFQARRNRIDRVLAFNHEYRVTLYEIGLNTRASSPPSETDLIVLVDSPSTAFENLLKKYGTMVLDENRLDACPKRPDIETVTVPSTLLAHKALESMPLQEGPVDVYELEGAAMFGAALAVHSHNPTSEELARVFGPSGSRHVILLTLATFAGYDCVVERAMIGKSLTVGLTE